MNDHTLFYNRPAEDYLQGIPLGNGRQGAVITGGVGCERINLNDDTLWSGFPRANGINNAYERYTKRIRRKILTEDDLYGAEDLADKLQGPYNESYLSAGELILRFSHGDRASAYHRSLDLRTGVASVEYTADGVHHRREMFCSAPDDVMVIRLTADRPGAISFTASLRSMIRHTTEGMDGWLTLAGRAPRHVEPLYLERDYGDPQAIVYDEEWEGTKGLRFAAVMHVAAVGGTVNTTESGITVSEADECVIWLRVGTNYNPNRFEDDTTGFAYCVEDMDLPKQGADVISHAMREGFDGVYRRHAADMEEYYSRVELNLSGDPALDALSTDERKVRYNTGASDTGFEKLAFDFGRYMLYSSSREGTQAANLQGIWCWLLRPQWSCNYTININTQMNYWGAEMLNMPECHLPLITMTDELTHTGAVTAGSLYGARGFTAHHNVDLWRSACPIGMGETDCKWSLFPTGGIWLALHVFEHYRFTGDKEFLRRYFHILKKAALFSVDMMCEMEGGYLGMCPATVPERRFTRPDGVTFSVGAGSTFDYQLLGDLYEGVRTAVRELGLDEGELLCEIDGAERRFPPIPMAKDGTIGFWQTETVPENYMWVNVLFGLYPGHSLRAADGSLKDAMRKTLEKYEVKYDAFSNTWFAGAWARFKDGKKAYEFTRHHISHALVGSMMGVNRNGGGDVFQIDSNLGLTAAMAEMLLQSDGNTVVLLPALPEEWHTGSLKNFRTRCGCSVAFAWKDGRITDLTLTSDADRVVEVHLSDRSEAVTVRLHAGETVSVIEEGRIS